MLMLRGVAGSPGLAIGRVWVVAARAVQVDDRQIPPAAVAVEKERFSAAVAETRSQLLTVRDSARASLGEKEAAIFDAHLLLLEDPAFVGRMTQLIEEESLAAEAATVRTVDILEQTLADLEDEYLRERAADIRDVGDRLLANLVGEATEEPRLTQQAVVVAADLKPSQTVQLDKGMVLALATDGGGRTSHVVIMARSWGVPAVVGLGRLTDVVQAGETLVVDGDEGVVVVRPDRATLSRYRQAAAERQEERRRLSVLRDVRAVTVDGRRLEVVANIGGTEEVAGALAAGAEGVGLCRTEFVYLNRESLPDEEEQFDVYRAIVAGMDGRPVTFRTLDIGGDKAFPYMQMPLEDNPFLGWRGIRVCLARPEVFAAQLRAILRASACGKTRLMFPMVTSLDELLEAKERLARATAELSAAGKQFDQQLEVGIMVEVPAAAICADILAQEVDFFSLGTNDLTQYTLAVDRGNEKIAGLFDPFHPALLRLIRTVVEAAHGAGIWVGICGESASEPTAAPLLVGLGLDELSASAGAIARIKEVIRGLKYDEAVELAATALTLPTGTAVRELAQRAIAEPARGVRNKNA